MLSAQDTKVRDLAVAILASSPDCVKVLSSNGTVHFVNACGLRLMGAASPEEVYGKNYAQFWPADRREAVLAAIRDAAAGKHTTIEGYCPTLSGEPRWWESHFSGVASDVRGAAEVVGITRDISERRQTELALRHNQERLALLLESTAEGVTGIDADGNCTFINSAGARILGYQADELIGRSLHAAVHHHTAEGAALPRHECRVFKATLTGKSARVSGEVFWHRDGHAIPVTYSVFPLALDATPTGAVVTFSDDTERVRVESDLRHLASELSEADRRKAEFIATLAHELRNPLAPLRTGLNLIDLAGDNPDSVRKVRLMMERQLGQMVQLINELLDVARITSGKIDLNNETVELGRIIAVAAEASAPLIKDREQALRIDVPSEALFVQGDAIRLAQVVTNLLNNAAQYTPREGRIELSLRRLRDAAEITVTDSGIGIAADMLPSLFEMFSRAGSREKGLRGGLGIGLNLVRRLVELHGGTVSATSPGVGQGSAFLVRLPLSDADAVVPSRVSSQTVAPETSSERLRIIVVDDNVDAADALSMLLELENHTVKVVNSGIEALLAAAEIKPDVVFLDIGMPGMNGYEVARALQKLPDVGKPFLVALTGWGGEGDVARSKAAGFDEHLTKPADLRSVDAVIAKVQHRK